MKDTPTNLDAAAVMLLEPQMKALREAINAAMPAAKRLFQASPATIGFLYDNLLDAVEDGPPMQGSITAVLDAFSEFTVLLVHSPAGGDVATA